MIANINGCDFYYQDIGSGPAIVLLHGNGEDHTIFDVLLEDLKAEYRVIAVDTRGHGQSLRTDPNAAFHYSEMAQDIAELIRRLELDAPVLYGFSDGGILGLLIAMQYPGLLSKLMISGANTKPSGVKLHIRLSLWLVTLLKPNPLFKLMLLEPNITKEQLQSIDIPTLVMAGEHDIVLKSDTTFIAASIPNATLRIIPGETHGSYIIHSEKLYPLLKSFLLL